MGLFGFKLVREKRNASAALSNKRHYEAADKGRRGKSFRLARHTGPNVEIAAALTELRSRSRLMARNNGWCKRAIEAVVKHTIGEGIRPAPLGKSLEINKRVKEIWRNWAETTVCDWYGKSNLYGLQELAMRSIVEGGDMIVVLRRVKDGDVPIKLQLCEGDFIDHSKKGKNDKGVVRLGVQFSNDGELLGYWLHSQHPGDGSIFGINVNSEFHSKENVLHVFELLRIGQVRGVPFGVSSFMKLSDFGDYEDAQLVKQKIAACFSAFIVGSEMPSEKEDELERLEPGIIERLGTGETVEFGNPPVVGDFDNYTLRILQSIAASYGITYEMLTMDYSRVNFTSGRMAKIDVSANFKSWQYNMMVPQFCAPVWDWFMDACLISGALPQRIETDWTAPRVQQLDPVKETNALIMQRSAGMTTLSEIIRENGRDPDELFREIKEENDLLAELGIVLKPFIVNEVSNSNHQNSD